MTISKLHSKCEKCSYKDNCDNKRMVACGILELPQSSSMESCVRAGESLSMPIAREHTPITINMGEYGTIETSIEEINEQIKKDFYKKLNCNFNSF
ncbi:MAG: hypothetical protein M0Q88_08500 [Bacilli bacterium]|nr:hypothetical protein [Bacilli bacterium]